MDETGYTVALTVDTKGLKCPLPILRATRAIPQVAVGQVMEVVSTDPGSIPDFKAWTRQTGHGLLKAEAAGGFFVFHIRRAK